MTPTARSPHVPVTPEQIAEAAIEAARAVPRSCTSTSAIRRPGRARASVSLYRRAVELIRESDVDVVLNLTAGMGGDLVLGGPDGPLPLDDEGTDLAGAVERLAHVEELRPEICTLDCGTMNFAAGGDYVMTNTPDMLRAMAARIRELGVRPELEVFDTGQLVMVKDLIAEGLIDEPVLIQLCMGIRYGAPDDPGTLLALVNALPPGASSRRSRSVGCSFRTWRWRCWWAATYASGWRTTCTPVRARRRPTPSSWSAHARSSSAMNVRVLGPDEVRERLHLRTHDSSLSTLPRSAALLGAGVIGGGWAARLVLAGVDVRLFDPAPDAPRRALARRSSALAVPGGG